MNPTTAASMSAPWSMTPRANCRPACCLTNMFTPGMESIAVPPTSPRPTIEQPMQDDLLWVYEGLTNYLGFVLTARSGLLTAEQDRDDLAITAAQLDHHSRPRMAQPARHRRRRAATLFRSASLGIVAPQHRFL